MLKYSTILGKINIDVLYFVLGLIRIIAKDVLLLKNLQ